MESLWAFGEGYGSLTSAQLSVGREEPLSRYIDGGVNCPSSNTLYALANCTLMRLGEALEIWAI
jgi:hypothetical protein